MRNVVLAFGSLGGGERRGGGRALCVPSGASDQPLLVYRLDRLTGEVIACQFAHNPGRPDVGPGVMA